MYPILISFNDMRGTSTNVGCYKGRIGTNVGLVQTSD